MLILLHVLIALGSMVSSAAVLFRPNRRTFYANYALIAATLTSGTYLVVSTHSALLPACYAGLMYLLLTTVASVIGHRRYAQELIRIRRK